jgi:hypothetical protein
MAAGQSTDRNARGGRAMLALVTSPQHEPQPTVRFCSHCAERPGPAIESRICEECFLGLVLEAGADVAPEVGGAFIVLNDSMAVCAVSRAAESLLAIRETDAVNRHVTELVVPADAEAGASLAAAVTWAARGDDSLRSVTVRPSNTFGIRMKARIGSCGPSQAAVVVFE